MTNAQQMDAAIFDKLIRLMDGRLDDGVLEVDWFSHLDDAGDDEEKALDLHRAYLAETLGEHFAAGDLTGAFHHAVLTRWLESTAPHLAAAHLIAWGDDSAEPLMDWAIERHADALVAHAVARLERAIAA